MYFHLPDLSHPQIYKLLASTVVPRPIAWVVTMSPGKALNAAPFSFFNFFTGHPPVICLGMDRREGGDLKDSLINIQASGEFVVNMVSEDLADQVNITAISFAPGVNELEKANLETLPSTIVAPPRIARSPVALECRLKQVVDIGDANLVIANVIAMHVADDAVINAEKCYIDTARLKLIGRMESPGWYTRTNERFKLKPFTVEEWERQQAGAQAPS